jgi:hypothetical protein
LMHFFLYEPNILPGVFCAFYIFCVFLYDECYDDFVCS